MKTAIVTGASSGIGLETAKKLVSLNYRVYGLARNFTKTKWLHDHFVKVTCDISDLKQLKLSVAEIIDKERSIDLLMNNAGIGYFAPHEEIKPEHIEEMVRTNLLAPMIVTRLVLRELKKSQGYIVNISSITAIKNSVFGCAYAATKAGIRHFGNSLFDEVRKSGVKVVTINPDIVQTGFYDHLNFKEHEDPESYITAQCVADAVEMILKQREGTVLSEITIRPQKHLIEKKTQKNR
jgi:short-subunit dehydrogenase